MLTRDTATGFPLYLRGDLALDYKLRDGRGLELVAGRVA